MLSSRFLVMRGSLPERLLSRIDSHAEARHMTRSGLLAEAARQWIGSV